MCVPNIKLMEHILQFYNENKQNSILTVTLRHYIKLIYIYNYINILSDYIIN